MVLMLKTIALASLFLLVPLSTACVSGGGGRGAPAVERGKFFGHDLRNTQDIVFVLDLSGSMSGQSRTIVEQAGTSIGAKAAGALTGSLLGRRSGRAVRNRVSDLNKKIEKVKLHLIASLTGLPPGARFNLVLFSGRVQTLSPAMIPANGLSVAAVSAFVERLQEGGSTNMFQAMEAAFFQDATQIVLLTDGLPTSSSPGAILDLAQRYNADRRLTISTVGVGGDQARDFLATLAQENGGSFSMYF